MNEIILATSSQHRKRAFKDLGLNFSAQGSEINENFHGRPKSPEKLCLCLARLKAENVCRSCKSGFVIGFDSLGFFQGEVLEKPHLRNEAFQRLERLSGKSFGFYTGVYIKNLSTGEKKESVVTTLAHLRPLTVSEIDKYLDQDPGFNTYALGFNPLGFYSSSFIKKIEGSYNNIIRGVPLEEVIIMLTRLGFKV